MPLVDYASSDDSEPDVVPQPNLDSAPPPLPAAFHDLYAGPPRLSRSDDPSLHGGRTRLVPHVEGNWAAHVYLEWHPSPSASALITSLVQHLDPSLTSSLQDTTQVPLPLHISLSAPLVLQTATKDQFRTEILSALQGVTRSLPCPLNLEPEGLAWYPNSAGTRGFAVLPVAGEGGLTTLLQASNRIAVRYGCSALYADGEQGFHVSIAWGLEAGLYAAGPLQLDAQGQELMERVTKGVRMEFGEVKVKIGREVVSVPFGRRQHHH